MTRRWLLAGAALLPACGYHLAGTANTIPKSVKTIAVPPFTNTTIHYKLTDQLPNAIAREFLSRTSYELIQNPNEADAVLNGTVINVVAFPTTVDPATGRAAGVEAIVVMAVQLRERVSGTLLYNQPSFSFRQRYEISIDPSVYFDESSTAFARLSRDVARTVVTAVLENF